MEECPSGFSAGTSIPTDFGGGCSWSRILGAWCTDLGEGHAAIRIISNGLPSHCFDTVEPPKELNIDFTIPFNPQGSRDEYLNGEYT